MSKDTRKIDGMTIRQWKQLAKIMNPPKVSKKYCSYFCCYWEALKTGKLKVTSFWTSKNGTAMVSFDNGKSIPLREVDRAKAY